MEKVLHFAAYCERAKTKFPTSLTELMFLRICGRILFVLILPKIAILRQLLLSERKFTFINGIYFCNNFTEAKDKHLRNKFDFCFY